MEEFKIFSKQNTTGFPIGIADSINKKLRGLSPHANYTDRAAVAGRRS